MNQNILTKLCKKLNIPVVGVAPWPLPREAQTILAESNPCPFTAADIQQRVNGGTLLKNPNSAIVCLLPYYTVYTGSCNVSSYTWGRDYHLVVHAYLEKLTQALKKDYPEAEFEIHCDTSPLADRYMAYLAGLGFYGKNHCFINPIWGSYVVIGTLLTSLVIPPSTPSTESCLACDTCIEACLGNCLSEEEFHYERCKSYLTQKKGDLNAEEISIIAKSPLLFGCDVCQQVCPHNQNIPETPIPEFKNIEPFLDAQSLATMTNREFKATYGHRAFSWRGKKILLRNHEYIQNK